VILALQYAKLALLLVLIWLVSAVALSIPSITDQVGAPLTNINLLVIQARGTLANLEIASRMMGEYEKHQLHDEAQARSLIHEWRDTGLELHRATATLNREVIPTLLQAIRNQDAGLSKLEAHGAAAIYDLRVDAQGLKETESAATKAITDLDALALDPSFKEIAANLEKTSENMALVSADTAEYVHRMTRPAAWAKQLFFTLLGVTAQVAEIKYGFR
jgi:hypothetical protein